MEFGKQIKKIRTDRHLTQEDLGELLHVSRQSISSWENNRNFPDLEMIVFIAKTFELSLDELILGDDKMATKLVDDGKKTRAAKLTLLNMMLLVVSGLCFLGSGIGGSYVDAQGYLIEPYFFLIPIGYVFLMLGSLLLVIRGTKKSIAWLRQIK